MHCATATNTVTTLATAHAPPLATALATTLAITIALTRTLALALATALTLATATATNVSTFPHKITQVYSKISNTMQEGRLTFVFLFCHVGRATAAGQYNVQIGHSYPYGTQSGLTSPGLI